MIYKAKNIASLFWIGLPLILLLDCFIVGFDFTYASSLFLSSFIGGGIGIGFMWLGNKDAGITITKDSITLTKTATDSTTINKSDIDSYHIGKEGGKTTVTLKLKDQSTVSVSSFALQLDDFESVMKNWMSGTEMSEISEEQKTGNPNFDTEKITAQATDIAGKAANKFKDLVAGKSEVDVLSEKLTNLSDLKDKGILNDEEYQKKKTEILEKFS